MSLALEIITPERFVEQSQADSVIVPAPDGELGILPHHAPMLVELQPGTIRVRKGTEVQVLAVSGGFVEVRNNRVSILAETAEMAQEIDVERARQAAERAKLALKSSTRDFDLGQAETSLLRALARLHAVEFLRRKPR